MATVRGKKPSRIGPFPEGMDNRVPDYELSLGDAGYLLRDAFNVDVTTTGTIKTRRGYALAQSGQDCHSLWAPIGGAFGLYCDAGTVYRADVDAVGTVTRTAVTSGFGMVTPLRCAQVNEAVYFTDSIAVGSYHPKPGPTPAWAGTQARQVGDQTLTPMPAGSCIAYHAGRLLVAVGAVLVYSEPFTPNLRDVSAGYEMFPGDITSVIAVEGGVFVTTETQTFFAPGGFPAQGIGEVLAYGAPAQQPGYRQDGGAHWMSAEGIVSINKAGELANLQEERLALSVSGAAATLWRQADGMTSIVAALTSPSSSGAGIGSFAEARIVRKESP